MKDLSKSEHTCQVPEGVKADYSAVTDNANTDCKQALTESALNKSLRTILVLIVIVVTLPFTGVLVFGLAGFLVRLLFLTLNLLPPGMDFNLLLLVLDLLLAVFLIFALI